MALPQQYVRPTLSGQKGTLASCLAGPNAMRVPAGEIESLVVGRLRELVAARNAIAEALAPLRLNARETELVLASANRCARASDGHIRFGQPEALRQCVKRVTAGANCVEVELDLGGLAAILIGEAFAVEQRVSPFVMSIEAKVTRAGKGKRIVIDADVLALLGTLSQNQIARRLGISQSTVSLIARRQAKALPFLIVSAAETEEA